MPRTWKPPCPWGEHSLNALDRRDGCDETPDWQDRLDRMPLNMQRAHRKMARALIKAAKQPEHGAASLQILLSSGYDPDARDEDGATALLWASRNGSADCVRTLLEAKASVNVDNLGWTPLMAASFSNSPEAVRALLEGGADRVETGSV